MNELVKTVRQLGVRNMMDLNRARRWGWEGILRGHFMTRAVQTLLNAGVLDDMHAQGSLHPAEYARARGLDPGLLRSLCEYLHARGVLALTGERFALTDEGRFIVESDLLRGWFELAFGYEPVLHAMPELLAGTRRYGSDLVRDGSYVATGSGYASMGFYFPLAVEELRRRGAHRVLDIGCGDGTFLRYACRRIPGLTGVGLDLSEDAIETGRRRLAEEGLANRITLMCGNALALRTFRAELAGVDAATTFFVLHELCDGNGNHRVVDFLQAYREALPGVPFHIFETIRPSSDEMRKRPGPAIEYFLLHDLSGQNPIGREAWRNVLAQAGFGAIEERHLAFARSSIFTVA